MKAKKTRRKHARHVINQLLNVRPVITWCFMNCLIWQYIPL